MGIRITFFLESNLHLMNCKRNESGQLLTYNKIRGNDSYFEAELIIFFFLLIGKVLHIMKSSFDDIQSTLDDLGKNAFLHGAGRNFMGAVMLTSRDQSCN